MRKILVTLATLLVAALAQKAKKDTYQVSVDWQGVGNVVQSIGKKYEAYEKMYKNATKAERKAVGEALGEAYKNTMAKLIMEFGNTVAPVIEGYGELLQDGFELND